MRKLDGVKGKSKKLFNYLVLITLLFLTYRAILKRISLGTAIELLRQSNKLFILYGIMAQILYWMVDAGIIYILAKNINKAVNIKKAFRTTMIGQYYSAITPYSCGSQPAQVYYMANKNNLTYGEGTAVIVNKFVAYQIVVTFIALIIFIGRYQYLVKNISFSVPFILMGILIHGLGSLFVFFIIFSPKLIRKALLFILKIMSKIKLIKNLESKQSRLEKHLEDYKSNLLLVVKNKMLFIRILLLTVFQLMLYFSITYFVYRALNLNSFNIVQVASLQVMVYMAVSFVPVPGTVGASEIGFHTLLKPVFGHRLVNYGLILWRLISYYFALLVSAILMIIFYLMDKKNRY